MWVISIGRCVVPCAVVFLECFGAGQAAAQQAPAPGAAPARNWSLTLGAGAAYVPEYSGGSDYEVQPLPLIRFGYDKWLSFDGRSLRVDLLSRDAAVEFGPLLAWRLGRDADDIDALTGLDDIDFSIEVGAYAGVRLGPIKMAFNYQYDVADGHNGSVADFDLSYGHRFGQKLLGTVGASIGWGSGSFMDSYFGIDSAEAASSGLSAYSIGAGVKDAGLSGMLNYGFTKNWSAGLRLGYTRIIGKAADSPVVADVGNPDQFFAGTFFGYSF